MAQIRETISVNSSGAITFVNNLHKLPDRIGFGNRFFPNLLIGSYLWGRAFDSETKPVHTGSQGVAFLAPEVHNYYGYLRLDSRLLEAFRRKAADVDILLITSTKNFNYSMRVNKLNYQILASRHRITTVLFESWIIIENKKYNPRIKVFTKEVLPQKEWPRILK
jgi:hypothetical protein